MSMHRKSWYTRKYNKEIILSRHHEPGPFSYVLVLDHLKASYNVGKLIRTANALGCREVHLVNIPTFDPSPAKGTLRQTRTARFETFQQSYDSLISEGYTLFSLDPQAEDTLGFFPLPEKSAFILGHEEYGCSFDPKDFPEVRPLRIQQYGKVNSMNVSIAGALASYEYLRQHALKPEVLKKLNQNKSLPVPNTFSQNEYVEQNQAALVFESPAAT
jgi:tRNA G18 (ribose-2'-O)-methylase SpoU